MVSRERLDLTVTMPLVRRTALATALVVAAALPASGAHADAEADRWADWHRARALRLEAEARRSEAVEEWMALTRLRPHDRDAAVRASVAIVELIAEPPRQPRPTDTQYLAARELIAEAMRRGAAHDPALAYAIGRLEFATGGYMQAERLLAIARRRGFDPARSRVWYYRAVVSDTGRLLEAGDFDFAAGRLERAIREYPGHPDELAAMINLATAKRRLSEHAVAEKLLLDVIAKHPWAARAHLALGQVYTELMRYDEAIAALNQAMERSREREDGLYTGQAVLVEALLWAAATELRRGALDAAERYTTQYETFQRDSPDAMFLHGTIALRRGSKEDVAEAVRQLRRAVRLVPDRREFLARLIEALHEAGEEAEAEEYRRKLAALDEARAKQRGPFTPAR